MIKDLATFTETFESFKKYLFIVVYNRDSVHFKGFPYLDEAIIIEKAIEYLEYVNVPVSDAFNYYNYDYPNAKFKDKLKNLVIKEFYRLEHKLDCKYIPI